MVIDWLLYGPKSEWRAEARHSSNELRMRSVLRRTPARDYRRPGHLDLLGQGDVATGGVGDGQFDVECTAASELVSDEPVGRRLGLAAVAEVPRERVRGAAE